MLSECTILLVKSQNLLESGTPLQINQMHLSPLRMHHFPVKSFKKSDVQEDLIKSLKFARLHYFVCNIWNYLAGQNQ